MQKHTKSLFEELESAAKNRDKHLIVESRGSNVISSAIHLLEMIERNFSAEQAAVLEKKLLIAIKNRDSDKFARSVRRTKDQE